LKTSFAKVRVYASLSHLSRGEMSKDGTQQVPPFELVRLAAHVSNGLKSRIRPVVGRIKPKARVSIVRWNLKEAGCEEYTNSRANLWSDEQKSHMRSCMWVRQQAMLKPNNYTESCMINEADGWRGRNVWYLGRSVRYALKEVTIA